MKERQASSPMTKSSAPAQLDPAMRSRMRVKCSITYPADDHLVRKLLVCFMSFITCFWVFCRCWILCFICIGGANVVQNVAPKPGIDASASTSSVVQQGKPTADIDQEVDSGKPVAPISATTSSTGESATAVANMPFSFHCVCMLKLLQEVCVVDSLSVDVGCLQMM